MRDLNGITTKKGRVVYDRKPHVWKLSDLARIAKKIQPRTFNTSVYDWDWGTLVSALLVTARDNPEFNFGGGSFGGGGATRDFSREYNYDGFSDMSDKMIESDVILIWKEG